MIWPFLALIGTVFVICCVLSIWVGGPDPEDRPEDKLVTDEWLSRQRAENKLWLHQTDAPGLTHTDDHGP